MAGKWISDLTAETPLVNAARRVLGMRLETVRDYLSLALHQAEKDAEYVHQLRVGTRRAGAALDIFQSCLPEKVYKSARKNLRNLRRAAGAARDWDVFLLHLVEESQRRSGRQRAGVDFLIGYAVGQRQAAQEDLVAAAPDHPFAFDRFQTEVLHALHKPRDGPMTLLELACPVLKAFLHDLDQAVARDLENYDNLHQVRIIGKRLRYAMEVFADCFEPAFREVHYPAVEEMQEMLGRANDSHVASQRLVELAERLQRTLPEQWKRYRTSIEALLRQQRQQLLAERERFEQWWQHWQQRGGEQAFRALLRLEPQVK